MCISLYGCYNIKLLQGNYEKKKKINRIYFIKTTNIGEIAKKKINKL